MFYQDKLVLVTGGTGFVGMHIVEELIKQGAYVRIPIHKRPTVLKDKHIETISADLTIQKDCLSVTRDINYVFHAAGSAGSVGVGVDKIMAGITTNLILTSQMLQAAWAMDVEKFLLFSSSTVYPDADYPLKEEEAWNGPVHSFYFGYGWMRRYLEKLAEFVSSKSKMKIAIVRPTAVYGKWDNFDPTTSHIIPALIRKAVEKQDPFEIWGSGEEVRDFLHVSDLARACLLMLEKYASCDALNIGFGEGVKIREAADIILKAASHQRAHLKFNTSKPTAISSRLVDTSKAKKTLGFKPQISLEDGIKELVNWYKEQ